jgi:hypothetical protein
MVNQKKEKCPLNPIFFSLTPAQASNHRVNLFKQIHEIVFHGNGGYDWFTIYEMPIWLRNFTFNQIQNYFKEQNSKNKGTSTDDINKYKDILQKAKDNTSSKPIIKSTKPTESTKFTVPNFVKKVSKK